MWLAVHVPHLPLQALSDSIQQSVPALIFDRVGRRDVVIACTRIAAELGVKPGLQLAEAHALSNQLVALPRNPGRETECLQHLANVLAVLTPNIHISDDFGLLLEVGSSRALFDGYEKLLRNAIVLVDAQRLRANHVLAPTARGARWLAKAHRELLIEEQIDEWLDDLPVRCMDIKPDLIKALGELNLHFLSSIRRIETAELNQRFGTELTMALDHAYGKVSWSLPFWKPAQAFHQYVEFLELVTDQQHWWPGVSVLLHQLQEFLRLRSQAAISVLFSFSNGRQQTSQLSLASAHGIHLASEWLRLLQAQLERSSIHHEISRIDLFCSDSKALQVQALDLFDQRRNRQQIWQSLLDLLTARIGMQYLLLKPRNHQSALPESRSIASSPPSSGNATSLRPTWLIDPPRRLYGDTLRRLRHSLVLRQPERIETLDGNTSADQVNAVHRDYYIAIAERHSYWWVYRERATDCWFLQGIFA